MRAILIVASLAACLGLAACQQSKSEATEAAPAPAAKKYMSRSATFYAGQEQILSVDSASVEVNKAGVLTLKANGKTPTAGYYRFGFIPRINAVSPPDGIYDIDVVGYKPQTPAAQVVTPVTVLTDWPTAPVGRVKGVRFIAQTNDVVAMLPAG